MRNHVNKMRTGVGHSPRSVGALLAMADRCSDGLLAGVGRVGGWSSALSSVLVALLASSAWAGPDGAQVVRGDVSITRNGPDTIIRASRNSIINYRSFDIGSSESVRFIQPDARARVLNRITGNAPTRIDGSLTANGRVYIVNPAGVVFGATSRVDVAGLYAAAGRISDKDFLRGTHRFTDLSGEVISQGAITADFVGLLGRRVTNGGTITAPRGSVVMAAGEDILVGERSGNIFVRVAGQADDAKGAAVTNTGEVNAPGGRVTMAAGDVYSMALNIGGSVKARTVRVEGQGAGDVKVTGTINTADQGSKKGTGGEVAILGQRVALEGAAIDASGAAGGGRVIVGGDFQGKGPERTADTTKVDSATTIKADATGKGDGGTVILWSDVHTDYAGRISAKGGDQAGHGGFIEVSGKEDLVYRGRVDLSAAKGRGGHLLLDPANIIVEAAGAGVIGDVSTFAANPSDSISISPATLDAVGASVTLQASNNITVNDAITLTTAAAGITMQAGNSIILNAGITTNDGAITLIANELLANGVIDVERLAGSASITFGSGVTLDAGAADIVLRIDTGAGLTENTSGNITLGNLATTGHALVRNIGASAGSSILRAEASSLVTAASVAFDASGNASGAVGASGSPIRTETANAAASAGSGGVFLSQVTGDLIIGGATLGGLTGIATTGGGDVSVAGAGAITVSEAISVPSASVILAATTGVSVEAAIDADAGFESSGTTFDSTAAGDITTLTTSAIDINHTGAVSAAGDLAAGSGGITVDGTTIDLAAVTTAGGLTLNSSGSVTLGGVTQAATVTGNGSTGTFLVSGALTTSGSGLVFDVTHDDFSNTAAVNLGAGSAQITTDTINIGDTFTANGGITLRTSTAGTSIGLGAGAGTFQLTETELTNLASSGTVTIGRNNSGDLTADTANLSGELFNLSLISGGAMDLSTLTLGASRTLTTSTVGITTISGDVTAPGGFTGNGPLTVNTGVTLSAAAGVDITGSALVINSGTIQASAGDIDISASGLFSDGTLSASGLLTINATLFADLSGSVIALGGFQATTPDFLWGFFGPATLNTGGASATIDSDIVDFSSPFNVGAGSLTITTDLNVSATDTVTANGGITIRNRTAGRTFGLGGAAGDITVSGTSLSNLSSTGTVTIGRGDTGFETGAITTNALALGTTNYDLALIGDSISTGGIALNTGRTLTLNAHSAGVSQSGAIAADNLRLLGTGSFDLSNTSNTIGTVAGNTSGGAVTIVDSAGGLTVGTVTTVGLSSGGESVSLTSNAITVSNIINAGAGSVTLVADEMSINATVSTTSGGILRPLTSTTSIGLGAGAGTLSLSQAELLNFNSTGLLAIGNAGDTGLVTVDSLNLSSASYHLHIIGQSMALSGLTAPSGRVLTLSSSGGTVTQTGAITAGSLRLLGTSAFTLNDNANAVTTVAANSGALTFHAATLTVGSVSGDGLAATNGITSTGAVSLRSPSITISQAVSGGPITLTTDTIAVNALVDAGASDLAVTNISVGRTIGLGNASSGNLNLTGAEMANLATTGLLSIGSSNAGAVSTTTLSLGATDYDLTLRGNSIAVGGITINGSRTLTLHSNFNGITQTGAIVAGTLNLQGANNALLFNTSNNVNTITGNYAGNIVYTDLDTLTVGGTGLVSNNNLITLTAPDGITINQAVNAGTSAVTLTTNAVAINDNVTGNLGINIGTFTAGTSMGLAGAAGALNIDAAELALLNSTGTVTLGNADTGAVQIDAVDLSARTYSLTVQGSGILASDITLAASKALSLQSFTDGITVGAIVAPAGFTAAVPSGEIFTLGGNVTTAGGAIQITGDTLVTSGGAFDTTDGGAAATGANVTITGTLDGDSIDGQSVSINAGTAGNVSITGNIGSGTRLNAFDITSALSASVAQITAGAGGVSITADTITLDGSISTVDADISLDGAVTATGGDSLSAGTGAIAFSPTSSFNINGLSYTLTADEITFSTVANSVTGTAGSSLVLQPATVTQAIRLGDAADTGPGVLDLTASDLAALASSLGGVTIGRADGEHVVTILGSTFRSATTIRSTEGGSITVSGNIIGENLFSAISLLGTGTTTTLNADIITNGAPILIDDSVILGNDLAGNLATLDTTNNGAVPAGASITITGTVAAQTEATQSLALIAGNNIVTLQGEVGAGAGRLNGFVIGSASEADLPAIHAASGGISLTGGIFTLSNGVSTTDSGGLFINNTGLLTISNNTLSLDGEFLQNDNATGAVSLGADITTTDDSIFFTTPVTLTADVALDTGPGGGIVDFDSTIDGAFGLSISAGTGNVNLRDRVGAVTPLGAFSVNSSGGFLLAQSAAPGLQASTVTVNSTGAALVGGSGGSPGGITSTGGISFDVGSLIINGALIAGNDISLEADGAIAVNADLTVPASNTIGIHAGRSGTGNLTFGAASPTLTADTITLRAGDGTGGAATTAFVDALSNAPSFVGAAAGSPSPSVFTIRNDADITDARTPARAQFADIDGLVYTLQSDDGTIFVTDASKIDDTVLTLRGQVGVNIAANIAPRSIDIFGPLTLAGNIVTDGDICFNDAVTLSQNTDLNAGSGIIFIKDAFTAGANTLSLTATDVEIESGGSIAGSSTLSFLTSLASANVNLGGPDSNATAGLDLSTDELARINDGFSGIFFGRVDGTGLLSVISDLSFADPVILRMNGAGGSIAIGGNLTGTGNGAFTLAAPTTSIAGNITTAGGGIVVNSAAVTIANNVIFDTTGGNTVPAGGGIAITGTVDADDAGNNRTLSLIAGTDGVIVLEGAIGADERLGAFASSGSRTEAVSVTTAGAQTYTGDLFIQGNLLSQVGGVISIDGDLFISGPVTIETAGAAGDNISITGKADTASGEDPQSLILAAGLGAVTVGGDLGATNGLSSFEATGATIATGSVTTEGDQSFNGAATIAGDINAGGNVTFTSTSDIGGSVSGVDLAFDGNSTITGDVTASGDATFGGTSNIGGSVSGVDLAFDGNSTITGDVTASGDATFGGTSNIGGGVSGVNLGFVGNSTIAGNVAASGNATFGSTSNLGGNVSGVDLTFVGNSTINGNVASSGILRFQASALLGNGSGGPVSVTAQEATFSGPLTIARDTTITADSVIFSSTILAQASSGVGLTVASADTTFSGAVGGNDGDNNELGLLVVSGGDITIASPTIRTIGQQSFGGPVVLAGNVITTSTSQGIEFAGTLNSDGTPRALTVNSGGSIGNTFFRGNVGETSPLASITTNANGTTFLPSIVRTNGTQTYLDDVRLLAATTTLATLVDGDIIFGATLRSDTSPSALTVNTSGESLTRFAAGAGTPDDNGDGALASIDTNADGSIEIGGDMITTGSQRYRKNTVLIADSQISGNGVRFDGTVDSDGTLRNLTIEGGAAGIVLLRAAGRASNLNNVTLSATSIAIGDTDISQAQADAGVESAGNQIYNGPTTIRGNLIGADININGAANVLANVSGNNIRFGGETSLGGDVNATPDGASVLFENNLTLLGNTRVFANNGPVTFGGTINSSGDTPHLFTVNNTGLTIFQGALGAGRPLGSLELNPGGTAEFRGGSISVSGPVTLGDAVVITQDTTINATGVTFGSTLNSDPGQRRSLIIFTPTNSTVSFLGAVGGDSALRSLRVNALAPAEEIAGRLINVGSNITTSNGMVFGGSLVLVGDSIIDGGAGSLFFRGTIDADSELNNRLLAVRSAAPVTISANPQSTDISPIGNTVNSTPFRFGGSVGARPGQRLGGFTIGAEPAQGAQVPRAATAVFANFNVNGAIPSSPNITNLLNAPTFVVNVGSGGFTMARLQKLTTFGNLRIAVNGGVARLGDLVALANLTVASDEIILRTRQAGDLFDDEFVGGELNPRLDRDVGMDIVAKGSIDFIRFTSPVNDPQPANITREGGGAVLFANDSGQRGIGLGSQIFSQFDGGVSLDLFNAARVAGNANFLLPLDLKTSRSDTNVATSLAGAIPRDRREREVTRAAVLSSAFGKLLESAGIFLKFPTSNELANYLIGRAVYQDVPQSANPQPSDRRVTINRLPNASTIAAVRALCDLSYTNGQEAFNQLLAGESPESRLNTLKDAIFDAYDNYIATTDQPTGAGFRTYLESRGGEATEVETTALEALNKARTLLDRIDDLALTPSEIQQVRQSVINLIGGDTLTDIDLAEAVSGVSVAAVMK
ncbi:MAG: filamentous hemagglutinin N-terminal domain-containing protein [Phycisphaeraceae bacterium]|nr:filamentous hemagglutinin N-terminal domain-containing protein [Phycisphaeraceae bacterium]